VRFHQVIAAAWLALVCVVATAHAEKRVALVIGNGAYVHADRLANPVHDARGMREALEALKFDVIYGEDVDAKALRRFINRFNDRVENADVALVYFAGHGATFGDVPYVVPVDAEFVNLAEMPAELVAVEELIGELRRAKSVRIAILDACRDNAAEQGLKRSRGGPPSRGLAPPRNPAGLIIAYATQHGATAADNAGGAGNSPFTAALLSNIATPGLDVKDMFFKVGSDVNAATGGRQRPEISISMYEQYALVPRAAAPPPAGPAVAPVSPVDAAAAQAWSAVKDSPSLEAIDEFLRQYGAVPVYGALARARQEQLAREAAKPPAKDQLAMAIDTPPRSGAPLTAAQERALKPKDSFTECAGCPEMVVMPAGSFTMGSPAGEKDRYDDEGPQHTVTIGGPFAVGKLHVTVDQFAVFARETGYAAHSGCDWRRPGFAPEGSHPVVCVSWQDAKSYAEWLTKKTGRPYRLLSEAEWEYAARGRTQPGTYPRFWFGKDENDLCRNANVADRKARDEKALTWGASCNDGYAHTSPAGHYRPNDFGLYDMAGNAWQWTEDCYHGSYAGAPADGSAWTSGNCTSERIVRGGSWGDLAGNFRAAQRQRFTDEADSSGFRLARTLTP
jgi:formylglycine-generating enzyme required for sulfatase activity/uncharacterized caspase-like protein